MGVSLSSGESVNLTQIGGMGLRRIAIGLGWSPRKGFLGMSKSVDFDASALLYDDQKAAVDEVWFGHLESTDGSVRHLGDDRSGGGDDDEPNEVIVVDLNAVPKAVTSIVFVVSSFSGETFSGVERAFCSIVDAASQKEIARYDLNSANAESTGFIIAKVMRHEGGWKFQAVGAHCVGRQRTIRDIEALAREHA